MNQELNVISIIIYRNVIILRRRLNNSFQLFLNRRFAIRNEHIALIFSGVNNNILLKHIIILLLWFYKIFINKASSL